MPIAIASPVWNWRNVASTKSFVETGAARFGSFGVLRMPEAAALRYKSDILGV